MILVDMSQMAISTIMAELKGAKNAEISVPLIRHTILNTLRSVRQKFHREYGELVIACDSRHYWRKDVFPHYKSQRKDVRSTSGYDWDSIFHAINVVKTELTQYFPYPVVEVHGAEADDVIAVLAEWTNENEWRQNGLEEGPQPVLILSGDHDFTQLQRFKHVRQYSPIQKKWVTLDQPYQHVLMEHVIRGDKGDGIPNFLSPDDAFVNKIRQTSIFEVDLAKWKTMSFDEWIGTPHEKNIARNRQLVDFSMIPVPLKEEIIQTYLKDRGQRDRSQILNYFMQNKMKLMIDYLGDF